MADAMTGRPYPALQFVPQPWMEEAACAGVDPELWFATSSPLAVSAALEVCADCPVKAACLDYAIAYPAPLYGIWGGVNEHDRDMMRRQRGTTRPNRSVMAEEITHLRSLGVSDERIAHRLGIKLDALVQRDRRARRAAS